MNRFLKIVAVFFVIIVWANTAIAQCAMCTKTAAGLDDNSAKGLNNAIIYLAFLPLTLMITIGYFWWKANKNNNQN